MQVQRNAAVQEKELLICVAHLIKDIAFCIGNHEKKEISEKFSSVLIENLQHQLKEWLVHIGMRQKDLQGQVKRMKAQLQHDVVHFVLNHDVVLKAYCSSWSLLFGIFITSWTYSVKFGQNISI